MKVILNEVTNTVHRHETGRTDCQALCGSTYHISHDRLKAVTAVEPEEVTGSATKCGRCFEDAGGY